MKVSFSTGPQDKQITKNLGQSLDNIDFYSYESIGDLISESTLRKIFFDRIVLSEKLLQNPEEDLLELNNYLSQYSSNTTVVYLCKKSETSTEDLFTRIFNSPLYTPVMVGKVSTATLEKFVVDDIASLKAQFYSLDVQEVQGVTYKQQSGSPKVDKKVEQVNKEQKKSFLGKLFGKKENIPPKTQTTNIPAESVLNAMKESRSVANNLEESAIANGVETLAQEVSSIAKDELENLDMTENRNSANYSRSSSEPLRMVSDDDYPESEDLELGLGDLGAQHPDTGFLDEEELAELEQGKTPESTYSNTMEEPCVDIGAIQTLVQEHAETVLEDEEVPTISDSVKGMMHSSAIKDVLEGYKIRTYVGDNIGDYVYNIAKSEYSKGNSVLVVDLDYISCSLLNNFNVLEFFATGCECGLQKLKVFNDEGIDILCNGFGTKTVENDLYGLISTYFTDKYDVVLVNCPRYALKDIDSKFADENDVGIAMFTNSVNDFVHLLCMLTSRVFISTELEDSLFDNSRIVLNGRKTDLPDVLKKCVFARGNWATKILQ